MTSAMWNVNKQVITGYTSIVLQIWRGFKYLQLQPNNFEKFRNIECGPVISDF